jgi:hypothetical protein
MSALIKPRAIVLSALPMQRFLVGRLQGLHPGDALEIFHAEVEVPDLDVILSPFTRMTEFSFPLLSDDACPQGDRTLHLAPYVVT